MKFSKTILSLVAFYQCNALAEVVAGKAVEKVYEYAVGPWGAAAAVFGSACSVYWKYLGLDYFGIFCNFLPYKIQDTEFCYSFLVRI